MCVGMLVLARPAHAACSGSGLSWVCTAGTSQGQVASTLGRAADGATLTFKAGSYKWDGSTIDAFSARKAVTLICEISPASSPHSPYGAADTGGCEVTASGTLFVLPNAESDKLYRISGFDITGNFIFLAACPGGACSRTQLRSLRIDHNTFTRTAGTSPVIQLSDTVTYGYFEGVIDHNYFSQAASYNVIDLFMRADATPVNGRLGTVNNLFVEANFFHSTTGAGDGGGAGCIDGGSGIGVVFRFNVSDNCRVLMHGVTHGYGPTNFEVYQNKIGKLPNSVLKGYRMIHHQGSGTYMVFQNELAQSAGSRHDRDAIVVLHYRAWQAAGGGVCDGTNRSDGNRSPTATYRGYPCRRQPARDVDGTLRPMYAWGNRWKDDGSIVNLVINNPGGSPNYTNQHLVVNRDLYTAVSASAQSSPSSPFDGATGMGFGTIANRPKTCTTEKEVPDAGNGGVGYWATDEGEWNSENPGFDGKFYICTGTNTWTARYGANTTGTPYSFPHPLQGGVVASALKPSR